MAQLRDAQTSEIIAEGTPAALVFLADKLGRDDVLFDGVGLTFDPDALLAAHEAEAAGLEEVAQSADASEVDEETWKAARKRAKELRAQSKPKAEVVREVKRVVKSARDADGDTLPHVVIAE